MIGIKGDKSVEHSNSSTHNNYSSGETSLHKIIQSLEPELSSSDYVFCTISHASSTKELLLSLQPWAIIQEDEGVTLILDHSRSTGVHPDQISSPYSRITLRVHSSLEAVGLTAVVSQALATHGISANMVAGFFHDHVFVPKNRANEALVILRSLQVHT
jgi:hypothetical protein